MAMASRCEGKVRPSDLEMKWAIESPMLPKVAIDTFWCHSQKYSLVKISKTKDIPYKYVCENDLKH